MRVRIRIHIKWQYVSMVAMCIFLVFVTIKVQGTIHNRLTLFECIKQATYQEESIRCMSFHDDSLTKLQEYCNKNDLDFVKELTDRAILFEYELDANQNILTSSLPVSVRDKLEALPFYEDVYRIYKSVFADLKYFPIPEDLAGRETVGYDDSFGAPRTYGGKRCHEGTDIIPSVKERGYFPVVSVSDGVIENIGWLELGGWRVGIRSGNGGFFYYAHLDSYALGLQVGDQVTAGQLLGLMGDTGYGKKEGTRGKFIVHLHFGIYVDIGDNEVSVNPYPALNLLRKRSLAYYY